MIPTLLFRKAPQLIATLVAFQFLGILSLSSQPSYAASVSYPLSFSAGWNLAGNSLTTALNVKTAFSKQSNIKSVWKWDASASKWAFYSPSLDNAGMLETFAAAKGYTVLELIKPGEGYWVNAFAAVSIGTQSGTGYSLPAGNLSSGWNAVATGDDISAASLTAKLGTVTSLWAWDSANSVWYFYAPSLVANKTLSSYLQSKGYKDFGSLTLGKGRGLWVNLSGTGSAFNMDQTLSDLAQSTTLAFSGLAMMTGNLDAQTFFPPGKVADYTGFQYLRDNDPDNMGHNTSFLTRVANNVIYILTDAQFAKLQSLASAQSSQIDLYGFKRFPLMKAFRRVMDNDIPTGSSGLNLNAVKKASRELYLIDGQISFDRAVLYANIINSFDTTQKAYLAAMKGKGWSSWPNITDAQINKKMSALPQGTAVAVMTYASDLFSWYAGSLEADVYFCPERHGTYYGGFYIKDAPAIGHEGYGIDEQLTATAGAALVDASKGYVTQSQATTMSSLVATQKANLNSIVEIRTQIATLLRSLITSTSSADSIQTQVLALSATYGELDGANNYAYANVYAQVYKTLSTAQKTKLAALRKSIMSGKYADGTAFDYSVSTTPYLYSAVVTDAQIASYVSNTDYLFSEP